MAYEIVKITIENELDILSAHKRTVQLSEMAGLSLADHTRFATALSEVCRNAVEFAGGGVLTFSLDTKGNKQFIVAKVTDEGLGIPNEIIEELQDIRPNTFITSKRGTGLISAIKLVDDYNINSSSKGTAVSLYKRIPQRRLMINAETVEEWRKVFRESKPVSPYEEIKQRNARLLELTQELEIKKTQADLQLKEIIRLNEKLREQNQELQDSHDKQVEGQREFHILAQSAPIIIWRALPSGEVIFLNNKWYSYTGARKEDEGESPTLTRRSYVHPDDLSGLLEVWNEALQKPQAFTKEYRLKRHDGEYRWHSLKCTPIQSDEGVITMWIGNIYDIDDQKRLTRSLEDIVSEKTEKLSKANVELKRSNEELEQFAYVASHDLKEPLRMVSSFTNLLAQRLGPKLDRESAEFMEYIREGAGRMQVLINDLLDYSRVGKAKKSFEKIDMDNVLTVVKSNLEEKIKNNGAQLIYNDLPLVNGSPNALVQLIQNLLDNALKFRRTDIPQVIEISFKNYGEDMWEFVFKDNGIGISKHFHEKIFIIFQRLHTRDKYMGTGIGLAICKKIVEMHNGQIWVNSVEGDGASFHFILPKA